MKTKGRLTGVVVEACCLLTAFVFIFSGFTKAVDPQGGAIKIGEYLNTFGLSISDDGVLLPLLSVLESTFEFVLGVHLLLGLRRKIASVLSFVMMLFMTVLTLYIYVTGKISDCGCFGEALHLSNRDTFLKNIFLLAFTTVTLFFPDRIVRVLNKGPHRGVQLYSLLFVLLVSLWSYHYLPLVDYRPYYIGQDIPGAMSIPAGAQAPQYKTTFILEKNGERKEFTLDNYPDSTWKFIDSRTEEVSPGYKPEIYDFAVFSDKDEEVTHDILHQKNYFFWLIFPRVETTDNGVIDAIGDIYDYCRRYNYGICGLTSSSHQAAEAWEHSAGIRFPFYYADETMLKTMIRSNPGVMLVKNGKILNKWGKNALPDEDSLTSALGKLSLTYGNVSHGMTSTIKWLLLFFIPLIFRIFAGRISVSLRNRRKKRANNIIGKQDLIKNNNTMRKKIVAGNWKMNMNLQDGVALAKEINEVCKADKPACGVIICTPFIHLASVAAILDQNVVALGAENCADKEKGAYTGEVSAEMVKSTGAQYVILGHSERRQYYNETPEILKNKVALALKNNLKVIFCCGETLEEREAGKQNEVVKAELEGSVFNLSAEEWKNIVLAYEPIWAIGTGKTATADQAEEMLAYIRSIVADKYGKQAAEDTTILYGGSCKPSNAPELFSKPDIDGGLIGGASLKAADFKGIIDAWKK